MKKLFYFTLISVISLGFLAGEAIIAQEDKLPESVKMQSRRDAKESQGWEKFDKSGPAKFLQVEHTAAASDSGSASALDGSVGERLIEIKVAPSMESDMVAWTLENKGPGTVWVLAHSDGVLDEAIAIAAGDSASMETKLVDRYCYVVVDSDGKDETTLSIKAQAGETEAKTVRGKDMSILWF
jgi:hypothetical protein